MRSVTPMKAAKTGYIVMAALYCLAGILLIIFPDISTKVVGIILAVGMIVFGCVKLVGYFSKDLFRLAFQFDLAFGLLLCLVGLAFLTRLVSGVPMTRTMIGVMILADGLFKIQIALDAKKFGLKKWSLIAVLAALAAAAGVLLAALPLESPAAMRVALGAALAADGALGLTVAVCTVKIIRGQNKRPEIDD